jgi:hypothetical protein
MGDPQVTMVVSVLSHGLMTERFGGTPMDWKHICMILNYLDR